MNPIGNFPTTPATSDGNVRAVSRFISTANPKNVWRPGYDADVASNAAVRYFIDEVNSENRPEYWEPFNEPFVKAFDAVFTGGGLSASEVINEMSFWFRDMARKIHDTPELNKMKVIGFSDAFPSFERRGFTNWRDRQKVFIDIAGADMDAMSVHPYDGVNVTGQANGRSGSNSEAILDLVETYTALKFGTPKKLAISEFGVIENGDLYPPGFNDSESALTIRGLNSMLFNFLERQDNIEITIPFITGRADFFYDNDSSIPDNPYIPALVVPTELRTTRNPNPPNLYRGNNLVLAWKANFYRLWKNVKGERATVNSDDLDIQAQVFVDGTKVYLIVNNLDEADRVVNLNFISGATGVSNVITKSVVVNGTLAPVYDDGTASGSIPANISLKNGETKVLEITYDTAITFSKTITREKYFGNPSDVSLSSEFAPVLKATSNTNHAFTFSGVNLGGLNDGKATLRIGVGVPLVQEFVSGQPSEGLNIIPDAITINGTTLALPTNWKGYDQTGRIEFFGLLEVDVPYNLLNAGNNTVTIRYTDTQGVSAIRIDRNPDRFEIANTTIASVVLSVERKEADPCTPITLYADEDNDGLGDPAVSISKCGPVQGYVANADDACLNDPDNVCLVSIPGTILAENFIGSSPTGQLRSEAGQGNSTGQVIGFILDPDYTDYRIRATNASIYTFTISAAAGAAFGGDVEVLIDNISVGSVNIPPTGTVNFPFNVYQDFVLPNITIAAGIHDLRLMYTDADTNDGAGDFLFNIDTVTVDLTNPLSTGDFESTTDFKMAKNPVNSELKFTTNKANGETYKIYGISGQMLISGTYSSGIDVSSLSQGLYFVEIKNTVTKFIKR